MGSRQAYFRVHSTPDASAEIIYKSVPEILKERRNWLYDEIQRCETELAQRRIQLLETERAIEEMKVRM